MRSTNVYSGTAIFLALLILPAVGTAGDATTQPALLLKPVLLELFTSEGCSSCPPADQLLADLAKRQSIDGVRIVPMSLHVDYWNNLGWPDPFAAAMFTDRQRAYADALRLRSVYTPQMIVNGRTEFVGSDRNAALAGISEAAKDIKANLAISIDEQTATSIKLTIRIAQASAISGDTELIVAVTEDNLQSVVSRGENAGRKLSHTAVVRTLRSLGEIEPDGNAASAITTSIDMSREWKRTSLHVIAFAQDRKTMRVVAVGTAIIPER